MAVRNTYMVANLDCAHCAKTLENMINDNPQVVNAKINFATGKLIVEGDINLTQLRQIASLEGATVAREKEEDNRRLLWFLVLVAGGLFALEEILGLCGFNAVWLLPLVVVVGGYQNFIKAGKNLLKLHFDISVLMSVAVLGALAIGQWREGAMVAFLFAVSALLEATTSGKARKSITALLDIMPEQALVVRGQQEVVLPVEEVVVGDLVRVIAGEKIPVDGIIVDGFSSLDQSAVTGESMPMDKGANDRVYAGTMNLTGVLTIQVLKEAGDTTVAKIAQLVEDAQGKQGNFQTTMEKFSLMYTPIVMILAVAIAFIPPLFFSAEWSVWIYKALTLLVIACPCALIITVPIASVAAISNGARHGAIIKGGLWLEKLSRVDVAVFDKTGTLSLGNHQVVAVGLYQGSEEELLQIAAGIERYSSHPMAKAICQYAVQKNVSPHNYLNHQEIAAKGIIAQDGDNTFFVGSQRLIEHLDEQMLVDWQQQEQLGYTVIAVGCNQQIYGLLSLADTIRPEAAEVLQKLRALGVKKSLMLTGDGQVVAANVSKQLGLDGYYAALLPDDKCQKIMEVKELGTVMMVGDGINDGPALAHADIGVAMGKGASHLALETAQVALIADDLRKLPYVIALAQQTVKIIKQNIVFALGLKVLVLLAVFPGWLSLWLAILADMGANVLVTLNSMRILKYQDPHQYRDEINK